MNVALGQAVTANHSNAHHASVPLLKEHPQPLPFTKLHLKLHRAENKNKISFFFKQNTSHYAGSTHRLAVLFGAVDVILRQACQRACANVATKSKPGVKSGTCVCPSAFKMQLFMFYLTDSLLVEYREHECSLAKPSTDRADVQLLFYNFIQSQGGSLWAHDKRFREVF